MALSLIIGPAHSGKIGALYERYRSAVGQDANPWLILPRKSDVRRAEVELARDGPLLGGRIATFDDLFDHLARRSRDDGGLVGETTRALLVHRSVARGGLDGVDRHPGIVDAVLDALRDLDGATVETTDLAFPLGEIVSRYRASLAALALEERGDVRRRALERLRGEIAAWDGAPVFAYGFEDLTQQQHELLEALSARGEVTVSLPYEQGRAAYASLQRTVTDLTALARGGAIEELPSVIGAHLPASLAHLERGLFEDHPSRAPLDGSIRLLEASGQRGVCDLVAETVLELLRDGIPAEAIGVVVPSVERVQAELRAACAAVGVPLAVERRPFLRATPVGRSLLSLLRFAWLRGERSALYEHLRSPYAGLVRKDVDAAEGKLRGNLVRAHDRTVEQTRACRGLRSLPTLDLASADGHPVDVVRALVARMVANAHGLEPGRPGDAVTTDLRAIAAIDEALEELRLLGDRGQTVSRDDVLRMLEHARVPGPGEGIHGRVALLDLSAARTRTFDTVVVLGLEQGSLPRRTQPSPLLDDDTRARLDGDAGARLIRADAASRDRYLFLTACTRAQRLLVLARQAASDEGSPKDAGPFWDAVLELFEHDDVRRATVRRSLAHIASALSEAPTERTRLRALVVLSHEAPAASAAIAAANGWGGRLARARTAFARDTLLERPESLGLLAARTTWSVSALERALGCSSAWFVERRLEPGDIDRAKEDMMRGQVAHATLQRVYAALPKELRGEERLTPANIDRAVALLDGYLDQAITAHFPADGDLLARIELRRRLRRDLEAVMRRDARSGSGLEVHKTEHLVRSYEIAPGINVSGKIDRVDRDPMSARGMVLDYKSGKPSDLSDLEQGDRIQVPLYLLMLRDVLGLEPMGGVYVPLSGGAPRGILRDGEGRIEGFHRDDYADTERFDAVVEQARTTAVELVGRIRAGDVRHDPRGGECPNWCDLWPMCRVRRA